MQRWVRTWAIALATVGAMAPAMAGTPEAAGITVTDAPFRTFGRSVTAVYHIDAPPIAVFEVLTDYAHMADFMPMVDEAKPLAVRPNGATVRYHMRYLRFFDIVEVDERTYDKPRRITWHATEGPLKVSDGSWTLTPEGKGTRVVYQTDVDPGIPVPPAMVGHMLKQGLPEVLTAIRLRVESKGTWRKPR
ncbi:Polyketide cyclase / dehydrase and lipid transport [compost metagenome]